MPKRCRRREPRTWKEFRERYGDEATIEAIEEIMKLAAPYRCNYCTNVKGEANHWHLRLTETSIGRVNGGPSFVLIPWNDQAADEPDVEHICSEQCAVKALSKWMATTPQRIEGK